MSPNAFERFRILIAGPGAMGLFLARRLSEVADVALLHKGPTEAAALERTGFWVREGSAKVRLFLPVYHIPPAECDIVIITFKSYSFDSAATALSSCRPRLVLTVQNGLGNCEKLAQFFPPDSIYAASVTYGLSRSTPHEVELRGEGKIELGPWSCGMAGTELVSLLTSAGLRVEASCDIKAALWLKIGVNACINPLATLRNSSNGALLDDPATLQAWEGIAGEVCAAASLDGATIDVATVVAAARQVATNTADNICSMLQDVRAGRRTEVEAICGEVVRRLAAAGMCAPACSELLDSIRALLPDREISREKDA